MSSLENYGCTQVDQLNLSHKLDDLLREVLVHGVVKGLEHVTVLEFRVSFILYQQLQKTNATVASCYHQTSAERERERERERENLNLLSHRRSRIYMTRLDQEEYHAVTNINVEGSFQTGHLGTRLQRSSQLRTVRAVEHNRSKKKCGFS